MQGDQSLKLKADFLNLRMSHVPIVMISISYNYVNNVDSCTLAIHANQIFTCGTGPERRIIVINELSR